MNIKIKEKRGITLVSLVVTIIVLLILSAIIIAMITGENGLLISAQNEKIESQKVDYRETIELSKVEEGMNKKINRTKKEKLEGIYKILRNGDKFKKDVDNNKASMELIDNDGLEPRIVIVTKEGWKYIVTVDGIIEGDIPSIDLGKADIKIEIEPIGWTNEDVEVVSIKVQNEEYKENKIQYSFDTKTWRDYKSTEKIKITENKIIYARLVNGLSISDKYATGNVINIDKKKPQITTALNSSNVTTKGFTLNVGVTDENSGLGKIIWYYKKSDDANYTSEEIIYKELHSIQSGETETVTKSKIYDNLTSGTYDVYAEIYDVAGNIINANSSEKPLKITLQTVAGLTEANTTFTANPNSWTNGNVKVTASSNVSGYTIQTSKDAQTWTSTATQEFTQNGKVYARLWDGTNAGAYSTGNVTNIDKLAPQDFTPTATSTTKSITVTASATDADATSANGKSGIAGYRFRLDSGSWTAYQTSGTYTWDNLQQTTNHKITVEVKDNAGNTKQATVIKGTGTVETAEGGSYSPTKWTNGDVTITLPTKEGFTTRYTIDGTIPTASSTEYSKAFTVSSNCTITYIYTDGTNIGGAGTLNVTNIDKDKPTIGSISGAFTIVSGNTGKVTISSIADTGGSGLSGVYVSTSSTKPTATSVTWKSNTSASYSESVTAAGTYYVWVKDTAGNVSNSKTCKVSTVAAIARVGSVYYSSITNAVSSISSTGAVVMCSDATEYVTIPSSKNITLNTNTKTITGKITNNGTLTITGNGMILLDKNDKCLVNNSTATLKAASIKNTNGGWPLYNTGTFTMTGGSIIGQGGNASSVVMNTKKFNMSGGTLSGAHYGLTTRGANAVSTVTGGTIKTSHATQWAVKVDTNGTAYISNAVISGKYAVTVEKGDDDAVAGKKARLIDCDISGKMYNVSGKPLTEIVKTSTGYNVYYYDTTSSISAVQFPTWTTSNDQDDIVWHQGKVGTRNGVRCFYYAVKKSEHKSETGKYNTHIYADGTLKETIQYTVK